MDFSGTWKGIFQIQNLLLLQGLHALHSVLSFAIQFCASIIFILSIRITNQGANLIDNLIALFEELYFPPRVSKDWHYPRHCQPTLLLQAKEYDEKTVVSRLSRLSFKLNRDYGDYLAMKATINLPFPGYPPQLSSCSLLCYFIYIKMEALLCLFFAPFCLLLLFQTSCPVFLDCWITIALAYRGMVHFAFVDRSFDELTSPSIVDDFMVSTSVQPL